MKGFGDAKQPNKEKIFKNYKINIDQLIKKGFELQALGRKLEAAKYYEYIIKKGIKNYRVFSNYGVFLNEIGKYKKQN